MGSVFFSSPPALRCLPACESASLRDVIFSCVFSCIFSSFLDDSLVDWFDFVLFLVCSPLGFCSNSYNAYISGIRKHASTHAAVFTCISFSEEYDLLQFLCGLFFTLLPRGILTLQSYWSLSRDHGLHFGDELMYNSNNNNTVPATYRKALTTQHANITRTGDWYSNKKKKKK